MLVAKISPEAKFTNQTGPFSQPTVQSVPFFTAAAIDYVVGASKSRFSVDFVYGNVNEEDKTIAGVRGVQNTTLILTAEELADWGTDDASLLRIIAAKLGTNVTDVYTVKQGNRGQQFEENLEKK